jgi:hypothetical protein
MKLVYFSHNETEFVKTHDIWTAQQEKFCEIEVLRDQDVMTIGLCSLAYGVTYQSTRILRKFFYPELHELDKFFAVKHDFISALQMTVKNISPLVVFWKWFTMLIPSVTLIRYTEGIPSPASTEAMRYLEVRRLNPFLEH